MHDARQPWWQVTVVFDPEGTGSDFGYTEGLSRHDLPELHLWARPTLGDDPGLDWKLSPRDMTRILNGLAWRLVDGDLTVGDRWQESYDEGYATARFSVHLPVSSEEVDAFGAGDAPVLPVKWELRRDPIGSPRPMQPADQAAAASRYDELVDDLDPARPAPPGWELPLTPSWDEHQRFGPRTPLVLARAAQVWQADGERLTDALDTAMVCERFASPGHALLVARAAARAPGRQDAVDAAETGARTLMDELGVSWGHRAHATARAWMLDGIEAGEIADQVWATAQAVLTDAIASCLAVEVMGDVLPVAVQTSGQGAVLTSLGPSGLVPDARWRCPQEVARAVAGVVATTPVADLLAVSTAWEEMVADERCWQLPAQLWTGSSHAPAITDMLGESALRAARFELALAGRELVTLQQWANALATVLTYRARLDPALVDTFLFTSHRITALAGLVNAAEGR